MPKLFKEVKLDLDFLRSHTLQPKWFKIFKIFILLSVLTGYYFLFGLIATILFFCTFFLLMLIVHLIYRVKTRKFTTNWLDFIVVGEKEAQKKKRIGKYYYPAIIVNLILSVIVSLLLT